LFAGLFSSSDEWVKTCGIIEQVQRRRIRAVNLKSNRAQLGTLRLPWRTKQTVGTFRVFRLYLDASSFD
jgi:hypothetical protein